MRCFKALWAPTRTNHLSWDPLEQIWPQSSSKRGPFGDYEPLGPLTAGPPWPDAPALKNPSYVYGLRYKLTDF